MSAPFDTTRIDATARECRSAADEVRRCAADATHRAESLRWNGGARVAQHRFVMSQINVDVGHDADDLVEVAAVLERHSRWIHDRESHLYDLERRILNWIRANPPRIDLPGGIDARLVTHLPSSLSDDWDAVARRLRALGAAF